MHREVWKFSEGAPYDREDDDRVQVRFDWKERKAKNPSWINVSTSFVESAKAALH
jgi:hypothetical protein